MIRNTFANRLAALATVALSVAGFSALDAGAQGKVRLNGGTGAECSYSSITVAPNGDLTVTCQNSGQTGVPVCSVNAPNTTPAGNITISASCTPAASSYVWTASAGTPPSGQSSTIALGAGTYTYTVMGSNAEGNGAVSAPKTMTVTVPQADTDVPRNCSFSTSPATPVAGAAATITVSCTNNPTAFAWYPYEGAAITGIQNQTSSGSQSVTFPSAGTYKMYLVAGNSLGSGDTFVGAVTVAGTGGGGGVPGCPTVPGVVGPTLGYETLGNLRFDLRPGSIGSALVSMPLNGVSNSAQITAVGATQLETPKSTIAEVAISPCPGTFDVPAACKMQVYGTTGMNMLMGPSAACSVSAGNHYVNIKHLTCNPATGSGINYCSHYVKLNGR